MTVYKKHICDSCGFSWIPKGKKPTFCPNCSSKKIGPSTFTSDLGIDSLD
ncbi:MAG: hypothetical protein AABX55_01865 [Nanoarchaeota archaeon]